MRISISASFNPGARFRRMNQKSSSRVDHGYNCVSTLLLGSVALRGADQRSMVARMGDQDRAMRRLYIHPFRR
jgi:hypothetical protein